MSFAKKKKYTIGVDLDKAPEIEEYAKSQNKSFGRVVREALEDKMKKVRRNKL